MKTRTLKLITRYDAERNEYTVFRHNLTWEEGDQAVRELSARPSRSSSLINEEYIQRKTRMTARPAAEMLNVPPMYNPNLDRKGENHDSTEVSGRGPGPVLNRNHSRNHNSIATEAVEEENPGGSRA